MAKKITVIGGSGFVGTNFCSQLALKKQDFEIIDLNISRKFPQNSKIGDVRILQSLRETITGDVVVHLAAVHVDNIRDKSEYQRTNVEGAENVAQVCDEKGIQKIIFTSSVAVYGFAEPDTDESGPINPYNEYGRTKYEAEQKFHAWRFASNTSLIIVRPTVIFGEGNRGNVFNLLNQIATGKFLMVGNGKNKKSMAYIGNVVAFLEACVENNEKYGNYNYVDTPNFTMNDLVSIVRYKLKGHKGVGFRVPYLVGLMLGFASDFFSKVTRQNLPISSIRVKKFASSSEFKSAKLSLDGFIPPYTILEGLERTLQSEFLSPDPNRQVFYTE
jgi:GlcNAc-P-P-Und epimerase